MKIGITIGDPAGIGPEIILKSISKLRKISGFQFIIISPEYCLEKYAQTINKNISIPIAKSMLDFSKAVQILEVSAKTHFKIGQPSKLTGNAAFNMVKKGIELALNKEIDALVTAPVSKYAINLTGRKFTGHTEMLKKMTGALDVLMFFVSPQLMAALVTTHFAIRNVSRNITTEAVFSKLLLLSNGLKQYFSIKHPKIAVSALNPHAGEGGYMGTEEIDFILPAIRKAKKKGMQLEGPFSSDTILLKRKDFDAILFMYHDQAMIPAKLLSWEKNVNVTLGLPFVRTSPDHGTAFDIAGKGIASPRSFMKAVQLACRMLENKETNTKEKR